LNDFEWVGDMWLKVQFNTNVLYGYKDQLILTGNLDDVGALRSNSEKSYRLGLEVDATIALTIN
jgi:iron complex outermembrane receptor protein